MAIRRCPYCKAIIDESQKYCNNCGTQLLFPEDELAEEDIKGEKIVDEDFRDEEDEFAKSLEPAEEEEEQKEEIDLEKVVEGEESFPGEEEAREEAEEAVAEEEVEEEAGEEAGEEAEIEAEAEEEEAREKDRKILEEKARREAKVKTKAVAKPTVKAKTGGEEEKKEEKKIQAERKTRPIVKEIPKKFAKTPVFKEEEIQALAVDEPSEEEEEAPEEEEAKEPEDDRSEAETREEIARLITALEKKQKKGVLSKQEEKIIAPLEESSDYPPWADIVSGTSSTEIVTEEAEEKAEEKSFVSGDTMDFEKEVMSRTGKTSSSRSTIGIPETVTRDKSAFHFDKEEEEKEVQDIEEDAADKTGYEFDELESQEFETPRIRLGFFRRLTAVIFDLIFISLLWLGAVWLASLLMAVPLKPLVVLVSIPLGLFYVVLLLGYFFLFLFFLGETLGGRLASPQS